MTTEIRGKVFTLTGQGPMTRDDLTAMINDKGGFVGSISRSTDILVTNSIYSKSRKMVTAKNWGIPIIDYGELMIMLGSKNNAPLWSDRSKVVPVVNIPKKTVKIVDKTNLKRSIEI